MGRLPGDSAFDIAGNIKVFPLNQIMDRLQEGSAEDGNV
jgi:hypothetical protein